MPGSNDVILTVDYHLEHLEVRWLNCATGQEQRRNILTDRRSIVRLVEEALAEATPTGGKVIWIMESTTGWARVKDLIGAKVEFILANVLQMPLPPKAHRARVTRSTREESSGSSSMVLCPGRTNRRSGGGRCGGWWTAGRT